MSSLVMKSGNVNGHGALLTPCMLAVALESISIAISFRGVIMHARGQAGSQGDGYANLSLGNIYFSNLEDRTKYEKHLLHAANFYHEVLKKDEANAFSGVCLGLIVHPLCLCDMVDGASCTSSQFRAPRSLCCPGSRWAITGWMMFQHC